MRNYLLDIGAGLVAGVVGLLVILILPPYQLYAPGIYFVLGWWLVLAVISFWFYDKFFLKKRNTIGRKRFWSAFILFFIAWLAGSYLVAYITLSLSVPH